MKMPPDFISYRKETTKEATFLDPPDNQYSEDRESCQHEEAIISSPQALSRMGWFPQSLWRCGPPHKQHRQVPVRSRPPLEAGRDDFGVRLTLREQAALPTQPRG
jgi:hypothetical protein